ncbi:uncharacterized protein N7511_002638 [Penicillium nucicola]|uniref:uncharacterized protein n=1 Tax=Penicillium nucicola TaxID=1850975 RepID=UPI0025456ADA|nr:uncharacterized protein N7511_002638 [Penicillium nucicola]KAJ5770587.1 hypothetical protein N7511_002638 [Penicillium nucicola]
MQKISESELKKRKKNAEDEEFPTKVEIPTANGPKYLAVVFTMERYFRDSPNSLALLGPGSTPTNSNH